MSNYDQPLKRPPKSDKKMDAGKIKFILLKEIGNAYIDYDVTDEEMLAALKDVILCNR
mgnify:CR=1 FL=1